MNTTTKGEVGTDVECYRNFFLVKTMLRDDRSKTLSFTMFPGKRLEAAKVRRLMAEHTNITFNGRNYDFPMIAYALHLCGTGLEPDEMCLKLKHLSDAIIVEGLKPWEAEDRYGFVIPKSWDHIDLIEVAPGVATSLKLYGGRMHAPKLQDLPIEPDAMITPEQRPLLDSYCGNDLSTTLMLRDTLDEQIALRVAMSAEYGLDLRSKSDAQIAEAVLKNRVATLLGLKPWDLPQPDRSHGQTFKYRAPEFVSFRTPELQALLREVQAATFITDTGGSPRLPPELEGRLVTIGGVVFKMGIGGLHSQESSTSHYADEFFALHDDDVRSYYPFLILVCELFPKHLGKHFLHVYRDIVMKRFDGKDEIERLIAAVEAEIEVVRKAGLNKLVRQYTVIVNALKIVLNGTFGKLGSWYSALYSPDLMIQVTVTGQLLLLMLIEMFTLAGIRVVSANTDGVVTRVPRDRIGNKEAIITAWEKMTGLLTENTQYRSLHSRDVNNYVAVKLNGKTKVKGVFTEAGLMKNPFNQIIPQAVAKYLADGTPVERTIMECKDVRQFVNVRTVRGGGVLQEVTPLDPTLTKEQVLEMAGFHEHPNHANPRLKRWSMVGGDETLQNLTPAPAYALAVERLTLGRQHYLGKVVRFYRARNTENFIAYKTSGNRVPLSDAAAPLMELPEQFPADIDHHWYITEARDLLRDVGVTIES